MTRIGRKSMPGRTAAFAALLAGLTAFGPAFVAGALAQGVPVPLPRPKVQGAPPADQQRTAPPQSIQPSAPQVQQPQSQAQPQRSPPASSFPFPKPPFLFGRSGETTALDARQRELADRVSAYLTNVRTLSGNFVQVGPDGRKAEGEFYLQKPGRIRFDYNPPSPIELIADGQSLVVRDRKLATQDLYPLSQTPLRFLLADRLDLLRDTNLVGVYADDVFVTVVIEERQIIAGTHRLMIMFGAQDYQLRQWTVTDPQGFDTTVAVYNLAELRNPDPNMFRIDYTRPVPLQ
jgi:outer membrane lipoprotein-sorting protein